jgi:hypothetical protein
MVKKISIIIFICFLVLAVYFLLEKYNVNQQERVSGAKGVGERASHDIGQIPHEMQRIQIDSEVIIKFKSPVTSETYELDEHELDDFKKQIKSLKSVDKFDPNEFIPGDEAINREGREYYESAE